MYHCYGNYNISIIKSERGGELRRFALAFIHSHSGATGVF